MRASQGPRRNGEHRNNSGWPRSPTPLPTTFKNPASFKNPPPSRTHLLQDPTTFENPPPSRTRVLQEPTSFKNPPLSTTHLLQERPEFREEELLVLLRLLPHHLLQEPDDLLRQDAADPADEGGVLRLLPAKAEGKVFAVDDALDEAQPLGEEIGALGLDQDLGHGDRMWLERVGGKPLPG